MDELEALEKIEAIIKNDKFGKEDIEEFPEFIDYDNTPDGDELFDNDDFDISNFTKTDITKLNTYAPSQFLHENEKKVIDSCKDPRLRELLFLNRTKNIQLMQLYKKIKDLLMECQENITIHEEKVANFKQSQKHRPRIWRMGHPYFKTSDDYPCPVNPDTKRKLANRELFIYDMRQSPKWSKQDVNRLTKAVAFQYKVYLEDGLEKQIKTKLDPLSNTKKELERKLTELRKVDTSVYPPLGDESKLNWNRISRYFLSDKYSDIDCQIFWKTYLHPDIKVDQWTNEENKKLKQLAISNKYQNWEKIADELGGNRTAFIACMHYYCYVKPPKNVGRFTKEEDEFLCKLVNHYRQDDYVPWSRVAHHFSNRTRTQVFHRYHYFLQHRNQVSKGKFTEAEDILILVLTDRFGKKFSKCAEYFPNRSVVQIKARYSTNLQSAIKKGSFTLEEDEIILKFVKDNGPNWSGLTKILRRSGQQLRQRYHTLIIFQNNAPDATLNKAPRKRYGNECSISNYNFIRLVADQFQGYEKIPTLDDIVRLLSTYSKMKAKSGPKEHLTDEATDTEKLARSLKNDIEEIWSLPSLAVDDLITDYFIVSTKHKFEERFRNNSVQVVADAVNNLLSLLKVELHIPSNYKDDNRLDFIDQEILGVLKKDQLITLKDEYVIARDGLEVEQLIPPNLNTMVGMRVLLLKNHLYKTRFEPKNRMFDRFIKEDSEKQILWCINNHLSSQPEVVRNQMLVERQMFFRRFVSLFKFPAIMSLVTPSKTLEEQAKKVNHFQPQIYVRRTKPTKTVPFETVYIKQQHPEPADIVVDPLENVESEPSVCQPPVYQPPVQPTTIIICGSSNIKVKKDFDEPVQSKVSLTEKLKRKINETLKDLTHCPSKKKFFATATEIYKPNVRAVKAYARKTTRNQTIASVIDVDSTKWKDKEVISEENIRPVQEIKGNRSYPAKNKSKFDNRKGELVYRDDPLCSSNQQTMLEQDLDDVKMLDDILKKEKITTVEESFEF